MGAVTSILGPIGSILGMGLGIFGAYQDGRQQQAMANYQAQVARNNQQIAEQNAKDAIEAGQANEQRQRLKTAQTIGAMRASAGGSGFDIASDSFLDDFGAAAMTGEIDALNIRNDAQRQANNYWRQAADYGSQAGMHKASGKNAMSNAFMNMGGTLLSGAGGLVDSSWYGSGSKRVGNQNMSGVVNTIATATAMGSLYGGKRGNSKTNLWGV